MKKWAGLYGDIFKNEYAKAESGQQKWTGLKEEGVEQYEAYLLASRTARVDKTKRAFEEAHLAWYKAKHDLQCDTYDQEVARRARANAAEGIAKDTEDDLKFDDSIFFGESDGDDSGIDDDILD